MDRHDAGVEVCGFNSRGTGRDLSKSKKVIMTTILLHPIVN